VGVKKEYIVELREEEADELMEEHWVGELVRCKDCKHRGSKICPFYQKYKGEKYDDWFCADGERGDV
jgi:hypothetical protein